MAKAKVAPRARARAKRVPTATEHLNEALMHLLRAVPVGHLDARLTRIEKWLTKLEKDVAKGFAPAPPRRRRATARPAAPRVRPRAAAGRRKV